MSTHKFFAAVSLSIIIIGAVALTSCAPKYQLNIIESTGGSVSMTPAGGYYSEGERITLAAVSDSTHAFTGWGNIGLDSVDNATSKTVTVTMPGQDLELSAGFTVPDEGWLFMIYMAGDNSLSAFVDDDINEIEKGLYDSVTAGNTAVSGDVKILILADTSGSADTRLYLGAPDNSSSTIASALIDDEYYETGDELNMAEPATLQEFVEYGMVKYPSEHNALVLWNHGGGVKSISYEPLISKGICEDDGEILYLNEIQTSLEAALGTDNKLDIIGMDACIMGEVETAYEMRTVADYFVASAANEWAYGWGYDYIFNKFTSAGNFPSPAEMADILVTQYKESTPSISHSDPDTMVAVKTSELEELKMQIDKLAEYIHIDGEHAQTAFQDCRDASVYYYEYDNNTEIRFIPYHDIFSFCTEIENSTEFSEDVITQAGLVKTSMASSIVAAYGNSNNFDSSHTSWPDLDLDYYETSDVSAVRGLSITIPHGELSYDNKSYYYTYWWYGEELYETTSEDIVLGGLDFCTYDDAEYEDGVVETWRELFEAWYDKDGDTPGKY